MALTDMFNTGKKKVKTALDELLNPAPNPAMGPAQLGAAANAQLNRSAIPDTTVEVPPIQPDPITAAETVPDTTVPDTTVDVTTAAAQPDPDPLVDTAPVDVNDLFFTGADAPEYDFGVEWDSLAPALQVFLGGVASGNAQIDPLDVESWYPEVNFDALFESIEVIYLPDGAGNLIPIIKTHQKEGTRFQGKDENTFYLPPWFPREILDNWQAGPVSGWKEEDEVRQLLLSDDFSDQMSGPFTDIGSVSEESIERLRRVFAALAADNPELASRQGLFDSLIDSITNDIAANRSPNQAQIQQLSDLLTVREDSPARLNHIINDYNSRFEAATGQSPENSAISSMIEQLRGFWEAGRMDLVAQVREQIEKFLTDVAPNIGKGTGGGGDTLPGGKDPRNLGGGGGDGGTTTPEPPEFDIDTFIAGFTESLSNLGISDEEKQSIQIAGRNALTQKLSGLSAKGMGQSSFVGEAVSDVAADMEDRFAGAEMEARALGTQIALQASNLLLGNLEVDEGLRLAQIQMANDIFLQYEAMSVQETLGLAENEMREAFYSGKLDVEKTAILMENWAKMVGLEYDRDRIRVGLEAVRAQSDFDWTTFVMGMAGTAIQTYSLTRDRT